MLKNKKGNRNKIVIMSPYDFLLSAPGGGGGSCGQSPAPRHLSTEGPTVRTGGQRPGQVQYQRQRRCLGTR